MPFEDLLPFLEEEIKDADEEPNGAGVHEGRRHNGRRALESRAPLRRVAVGAGKPPLHERHPRAVVHRPRAGMRHLAAQRARRGAEDSALRAVRPGLCAETRGAELVCESGARGKVEIRG
ncbi:hypothetical protein MBR_07950, partial [Metarhizium brunneum ARSEF 3297]